MGEGLLRLLVVFLISLYYNKDSVKIRKCKFFLGGENLSDSRDKNFGFHIVYNNSLIKLPTQFIYFAPLYYNKNIKLFGKRN